LAEGWNIISLWDIGTDTKLWEASSPSPLNDVAFGEDESIVYAGGWDGVVRIWDAETGQLLNEMKGHRGYSWYLSTTADVTRLASFSADRTGRVWDLTASAQGEITGFDLPGRPTLQSGNFVENRAAMLIYPDYDKRYIEPGVAVIFDATSGEIEHVLEGYGGQVIRLSPDGKLIAGQPFVAPGLMGPVHIRDIESGEVLVELKDLCTYDIENGPGPDCADNPEALGDSLTAANFSPDGSMLAIAGYDSGIAGVWDVESGERLVWKKIGGPGSELALWFSPTSDLLLADANKLAVYEPEGWTETASIPTEIAWFDLLFTPDRSHLVGLDPVAGIFTFDASTWEPVGDPLLGHEGGVLDIDLSSDGSLIASAGNDGFVRIWRSQTGDLEQAIPLGDPVLFVHFIDDQHLLVVPDGRPALVMTVDIPELIDIARSKVTRSFTQGECDTYHIDTCPALEDVKEGL
jgi:WD40 repeat protein